MLPVILLCRVYSAYLNTTPDAHMHRMQRPLPIQQLYSPDAPAAGLLALLKFALWQVLWVEPSTGDLPLLHQHGPHQLPFSIVLRCCLQASDNALQAVTECR